MKRNIFYLYLTIGILILCVGCVRTGDKAMQSELAEAESVMFSRPDSALHLLQSMPMPSARRDEGEHALWCLLFTQAQYKQMMKIPSDSLIRIAYNYYLPTADARRKAMSALYMGGVNYDLGNVEEAIRYYLEAKSEMEKTDDYRLGYLVMSGLGDIYLYRDLTDYALDACTQAYDYAVKDSNERYQMASLKYLARCYCLLGDLTKAEDKYRQSSEIASKLNEENAYYSVQREIALIYTNSGQFDKSLKLLKSFPMAFQVSSLIGKNYLALHQLDSAYYYLNKGLRTDNIYVKESIYKYLYRLSSFPKYHQYMKTYCDSLLFYTDSIWALDKGKEIIAYKEKYDNEKLVSEKQRVELEKAHVTYWWMCTLLMACVLILFLLYIYFRKRISVHKKEEELTNLSLQLHEKELEVDRNELYIANLHLLYEESNKKEELWAEQQETLCKLEKENKQLHLEKKLLYEKIASYSISSYEVTNVKILSEQLYVLKKREQELCTKLLEQTSLLRRLHLKPVYLNEAELKNICSISDSIFQNFSHRLLRDIPSLSERELSLCCLIKLRFSITEISILLSIASASVSRLKLRVKNKINLELGDVLKDKSLDIWIWEY